MEASVGRFVLQVREAGPEEDLCLGGFGLDFGIDGGCESWTIVWFVVEMIGDGRVMEAASGVVYG